MTTIKKSILKKVFKKRAKDAHKYDFGHLLVVGGSKLYSGSPGFNALAAIKTGVDLVTVAAPQRAADIVAGFGPDLITYPLAGDYLAKKHLKELLELAKNKTAVAIGGGLGREKETLNTVKQFLKEINVPVVIDADAIYAVAENKKVIEDKNFIITPHLYEFYVLSGHDAEKKSLAKRMELVKQAAKKFETTILLKANVDIISDGQKVALNKTGNPYMTKGGTGDTLTGICGSFLAQGIDPFTAACAAAYLNGRAGDKAASRLKESLMAIDVIRSISEIIAKG